MKAITILSALIMLATVSSAEKLPATINNIKPASVKSFNPVFNFIHAHRQGRGITVAWSSLANSSEVNSFAVYRTYEDPNDPNSVWNIVNTLPCNNGRNYRVTDTNVAPGTISYVVVASFTMGGTEMSEIRTVRIVQH